MSVTARTSLPTAEVAGGSSLAGVIVVTNPTSQSASFSTLQAEAARSGLAVGLENDEIAFEPVFAMA